MNTIKKYLSIIIALALIVSCTAIPASAAEKTDIIASDVFDPISDLLISEQGAISLKSAYSKTGVHTVVGQVVSSMNGNTFFLQDVVNGEIVGLQIYDPTHFSSYVPGEIVAVTGNLEDYYGVRQMTSVETVVSLSKAQRFTAQEVSISELLLRGRSAYISEYIVLKNVTLGALDTDGYTKLTDNSGDSINVYKSPEYPSTLTQGSKANVYAFCSAYSSTVQLRVCQSDDYVSPYNDIHDVFDSDYDVDSSISAPLARWAGSSVCVETELYGDLYDNNDQLDENSTLSLSTGAVPIITSKSTSTGSINYFAGSKGLSDGGYYLLKLSSAGFGNIKFAYRMRGSATSAANWRICYSADGENYKTAYSFKIKKDSEYIDYCFTLPAGCCNQKELYLRIEAIGSTSINGNQVKSTGANRFQDIVISGNPVIDDSVTAAPHVSPSAGEALLGQEITMDCSTAGATIYYSFNNSDFKVYKASSKPTFTELPSNLTVYASKPGLDDSARIIYNYTYSQASTVKISPNGGAIVQDSPVKLSCSTAGATIYYLVSEFLDDNTLSAEDLAYLNDYNFSEYNETQMLTLDMLPCTVVAYAAKDGYKDSPMVAVSFSEREGDTYNTYFGQVHSHTTYSDGAGSCEDAFNYAKNEAEQIDFLGVTDHSNSFDNENSASITDGSMSEEWLEGHRLAKEYTGDGFVGLYGYEMTWSNGLGHMNTYNTAGFQSRTQKPYTTMSTSLPNYYNTLKTVTNSLSAFNHPGDTFGDFEDFAHYDEEADSLITMIEVGNGEGAIGSSGYFPSYEYYTRALDKGWHLAPTNNQDNHKGYWGDANTARSCLLADGALTEEKIYDAMRNMRMYATEDNDLIIGYTLDGHIMGTILEDGTVGDMLTLQVDLADPTDVSMGTIEVVVNGGLVVYSEIMTSNEGSLTIEVPSSYSYYYIKVTQADGDIAVTAPVWVGEVEAVGIASFTTDTKLAVQGESAKFTLELYNNETSSLDIESITFYAEDEEIRDVNLNAADLSVLNPGEIKNYTFSYAHDALGATDISVVVKGEFEGAQKVYNGVIKLSYMPGKMVTNVIVDGTHNNDYVTGYYGGEVNNLISYGANLFAKVHVEENEITEEMLENCQLLIISAPARKNGTNDNGSYTVKTFEDSFIKAVANYAKSGGTVVICGAADYSDAVGYTSSGELNKLLKAMNSTMRLNSDEVYDDENYTSQKYKILSDVYDWDSPLLEGVTESAYDENGELVSRGQRFNFYSGCSVDTGSNGHPIVRGYDTTYSKDCKTDTGASSDESVYVEQGDVTLFADEVLSSGGMVYLCGNMFVSDYQMPEEEPSIYSNRKITENIIKSVAVKLPVSNISDVRKSPEGDAFRVQGTVTAGTANEYTTFFDTIYIEDETGGITIYPYSVSGLNIGATVDITGWVDSYQGDLELQVITAEVIDNENLKTVTPLSLPTAQSMLYDAYGGRYIQTEGVIVDVTISNNAVSQFRIDDGSGISTIFIDGNISSASKGPEGKQELLGFIQIGATVSAAGMLYLHPEGDSEQSLPCLRVNNTDDIVLIKRSEFVKGDLNGDKEVNMKDVTTMQRIIAELDSFDNYYAESKLMSDVTNDSEVNLKDVVKIQRFIAKLIEYL